MTLVDPHLDAYQLSAALDGEPDGAATAHLDECPACREELARWRAQLGRLAAPATPAPAADVDAAVGTALAAWSPPLRARLRAHRGAAPLLRVAAAVAVTALVAVGVVGLTDHGGTGGAGMATSAGVSNAGGGTSAHSSSPAVRPLGSVSGPAALVTDLRPLLRHGGGVAPGLPCTARAGRLQSPGQTLVLGRALTYEGRRAETFVSVRTGRYVARVLSAECATITHLGF